MTSQSRGETQSEASPQSLDKTSATAEDDAADDPLSSACDYSSDDAQESMRIKTSSGEEKNNQRKQFTVPDARLNTGGSSSSNSDTKATKTTNPQESTNQREGSPLDAENQEEGEDKNDKKKQTTQSFKLTKEPFREHLPNKPIPRPSIKDTTCFSIGNESSQSSNMVPEQKNESKA